MPGAFYQRKVKFLGIRLLKGNELEVSMRRRHVHFYLPADERFFFDPIFDEVLDRYELEVKLPGNFYEIRQAGHGPIFVHDFNEDARRFEASEPCEINGSFRVPCPSQNASAFC